MSSQPVIVIGGPTASGKSRLGILVAQEFGGEVVNADSMQMYGNLKIVTARPGPADQAGVRHHLYGHLGLHDRNSAGSWCKDALATIQACQRARKLPVLVGGTGLYLRFLMSGMHRIPNVPPEIRIGLNERLKREGVSALYAELAVVDPDLAERLKSTDSQRIVRALEIFMHTGKCMSTWRSGEMESSPSNLVFFTVIVSPHRDELYRAVNTRFDRMLEAGAVEEVKNLLAYQPDADYPPLKAVGVPPIQAFLAGDINRDRMVELAKRDTRRYAKRQSTWFRSQIIPNMTLEKKHLINPGNKFFSEISNFLLTVQNTQDN